MRLACGVSGSIVLGDVVGDGVVRPDAQDGDFLFVPHRLVDETVEERAMIGLISACEVCTFTQLSTS